MNIGDGTRTFGANGIFAIVCNYTDENTAVVTTNPYESLMHADANVLVIELTGNDVTGGSNSNTSTQTPDIGYDGNFADATGSFMLISATDPDGAVIDADLDGNIDATGDHTSWTLYDSVAFMDDDLESGGIERAYAQIVFAQENSTIGASQSVTAGATLIDFPFNTDAHIIIRQGASTGYTINDWAIGDTSGDSPNWELDSDTLPAAFEDWAGINTVYGALNPTAATLSTESLEINDFKIYPNPAKDYITIESNVQISSVQVHDILGKKVISQNEITNNRLDVSSLNNGVYFIKVNANGNTITKKIIIE
ncbi:T9SS type A sorting domain-containing protein [Winogradskyella echinorum]|uniref:T9SS type A sorting domain-containing protein n=2 Tax=Winogradskyella echinorum TaxID=538189 RepID=A0ABR6XWC6_9FLAO|nr:T9SS type A sorting domain-containing protein [Winogradskyella echinorum]MBC5749148.1 T9SS type A sorting domain-containing protein [Winogradskyella echinorum]